MKIVVFIKQVADNTRLKVTDGQPVLEGASMMMNPFDEYALETALRLKEQAGGDSMVTAISMGLPGAKDILKKAIASGADEAFLIDQASFPSRDSSTNSEILAQAAKTFVPGFDILVFGQMALDDAEGQMAPKVAELLHLPSVTAAKNIQMQNNRLHIFREVEAGLEEVAMSLPGVMAVIKCDYELRSSNIKGVMKANKTDIPSKGLSDLGFTGEEPTPAVLHILKSWTRPPKASGRMIEGTDAEGAAQQLMVFLKESKML